MSHTLDSATTARLPFTSGDRRKPESLSSDDTANLVRAVRTDLSLRSAAVHPYAEGVIRFYRARTILTRERGQQTYGRAWYYLARLRPHDLPPIARRSFFELVYFMQEQAHSENAQMHEFRSRILHIAEQIDRFMDELDSG